MKADTYTPAQLFFSSSRYVMPMFQRPYVWDEANEWVPLWGDIRHVAETVHAAGSTSGVAAHFLGAIVTEQVNAMGQPTFVVIDGQQRLTSLQVLIDAAERVVRELGHESDADALRALVLNKDWSGAVPDDETRFKVWPTNRDRAAFEAAMDDARPVAPELVTSRLVRAHAFFERAVRDWVGAGATGDASARLHALAMTLRTNLTVVGISLAQADNAQVIFETLNFRGTPLLAADLIKNHLFQRAQSEGRNLEKLYQKYWASFDGDGGGEDYWRQLVRQGRLNRPRIDQFLGHWLVMKLGKEVPSDRIFAEFRDQVSNQRPDVEQLMQELHRDAAAYRSFMDARRSSRLELHRYRMLDVLDASSITPLVLWLLSHDCPEQQRELALASMESWLVRRAVVRLGTKDLNRFVIDIVRSLQAAGPELAGETVRNVLLEQASEARLWPDDAYVVDSLKQTQVYRVLKRSLNRLLLEAIEDDIRRERKLEGDLCPRELTVEHIMPQKWQANWPLADEDRAEALRTQAIHTLGNLTLVTGSHNSSLSNRPWLSEGKGKRDYLQDNSSLKLNSDLTSLASWSEEAIVVRSKRMSERVVGIWPRPEGGRPTSELLSGARRTRTVRPHKDAVFAVAGPGFVEEGLSRRRALGVIIHRLHEVGVPMESIAAELDTAKLRKVPGIHHGEALFARLVAEHAVNPRRPQRWLLDRPIHEAGDTWVLARTLGTLSLEKFDRVVSLSPDITWSMTARETSKKWDLEDVLEALEDRPDWTEFVETLAASVETFGGRTRGTAASLPSVAFGVPGNGGEVWPYTFYSGELEQPLRLSFNLVARPTGSDERFLDRVEPLLPSLDAAAIRASDFRSWPAVPASDLLVAGVAEQLGLAAEEYVGVGVQPWWGIHNDTLEGQELRDGGFVSLGWDELNDLREFANDREGLKARLRQLEPAAAEGAIANWAGTLMKFAFELKPRDYVISPVKSSRTVDIGMIDGAYWFEPGAAVHRHRLPVRWLETNIPRDEFSDNARHEIGSALTLFRVQRNVEEFASKLSHRPPTVPGQ